VIDLGKPALHSDGVTVFADHADAGRFHYLPDAPRLRTTADGQPELRLLRYRVDQDARAVLGSGLLALTVDLGVADDRLARLRSRLAARTGRSGITLAPVSAESGRADVVLLGSSTADGAPAGTAATFVVRPLAAGSPMLHGDKAATFMAVLSAEGTTLVQQAMRGGGLPVGVLYSLRATGIRPALRASVTARWQDVYHFYENRLHGGKLLLATDIGPTVEELVHSEAISIKIDDLVPAGERADADRRAVDEVQRYVLQELFTPTLGQAPPPSDAQADGLAAIGTAIKDIFGVFAITYSLRQIDRHELKTFHYDLSTAQAEEITLSPQGSFTTELGGVDVERLIVDVEPSPSPEMLFDVGAARDLAAEDIDRVEVTVSYGEHRHEITLDAQTPRRQVSVWYEEALGPEVGYRYGVHFTPSSGDVDVLEAPPRSTEQRVIRIDPRELYQRAQTRVVAQGVPFDRYPRVLVDLRYQQPASGWTAERTVELGPGTPEAAHAVRVALGQPLLLQRRVRYLDTQGQVLTVDWDSAQPGVLVVGDPLPDIVDVQLIGSARFGIAVARLIVELRPLAEPGRVDTRVLTADAPVATWSWAARDGVERGYDYRVTVHTVRGEVREGGWLPGTPGKLVVGEGIAALREVALYLVGPPLQQRGLLAVKVRFSFADGAAGLSAEHEELVTDPSQPVRWVYPVADPARAAFTYQLTAVRADGQVQPLAPVTTSDLIVIAPMPNGGEATC